MGDSLNEVWGFDRRHFPIRYRGHEIHVLHNTASKTVDSRLRLHLTLHCPKCDEESVVRGRLPPEYYRYEYRAALAKFAALSHFADTCDAKMNYSYHGP